MRGVPTSPSPDRVLLWLIYGIWIDSLPVILANAVTLLLQGGIIALKKTPLVLTR